MTMDTAVFHLAQSTRKVGHAIQTILKIWFWIVIFGAIFMPNALDAWLK